VRRDLNWRERRIGREEKRKEKGMRREEKRFEEERFEEVSRCQ
jgi:hypothetical protein